MRSLPTTPKRLHRRGQTWVLEVERLIATGALLLPRTVEVEGPQRILEHLDRWSRDPALLQGARMILEGSACEDSYEPFDGSWTASDCLRAVRDEESLPAPAAANAPAPSDSGELAELRRQNEQLTSRLARLERLAGPELLSKLETMTNAYEQLVARLAVLEGAPRNAEGAARGGAPLESPANAADEPPATVEGASASAPSDDEPQRRGSEAAERSGWRLPSQQELAACLEELVEGAALEVVAADADDSGMSMVCMVVDGFGEQVGAFICDNEAAIRIGSLLMTLSNEDIAAQLAAGEPGDDARDAMAEVFDAIVSLIKAGRSELRIRTAPIEAFDAAALDWLAAAPRRDVAFSIGGRMTLAVR